MHRFVLPADFDRIDELSVTLTAEAAGHLDPDKLDCLQIALSEALVNIAKHGYGGRQGIIEVTFAVERAVTIALRDNGMPIPASAFDGLSARSEGEIHSLEEAGRGMRLIHDCCDELDYRSTADGNVMTMVFHPIRVAPGGRRVHE